MDDLFENRASMRLHQPSYERDVDLIFYLFDFNLIVVKFKDYF